MRHAPGGHREAGNLCPPAALASLEDILFRTIEQFGDAQAERYTGQLIDRLEALTSGRSPRARPCERLIQGKRDATGLSYYREGQHYLILRETPATLELIDVFHSHMDIEARLRNLQGPQEDRS